MKNKGFTPLEKSQADDKQQKKRFLTGFTVVELLTAIAIMAILVGVLLPALTYVRNSAKETMQKAQFATIELALTTFRNDYGDYPPSDPCSHNTGIADYCGAQKLAEALLGWDLLGFHPKSAWSANGLDENNEQWSYDPARVRGDDTLDERKGPYLELGSANAFRLGISSSGDRDGLFDLFTISSPLNPNRYVLCDVFGAKKIIIANPLNPTITTRYNAGTPILYFKADTSFREITPFDNSPYKPRDNKELMALGSLNGKIHPFYEDEYGPQEPHFSNFLNFITDPKASAAAGDIALPYRPDSYILISAGVDGLYGTGDDIANF